MNSSSNVMTYWLTLPAMKVGKVGFPTYQETRIKFPIIGVIDTTRKRESKKRKQDQEEGSVEKITKLDLTKDYTTDKVKVVRTQYTQIKHRTNFTWTDEEDNSLLHFYMIYRTNLVACPNMKTFIWTKFESVLKNKPSSYFSLLHLKYLKSKTKKKKKKKKREYKAENTETALQAR